MKGHNGLYVTETCEHEREREREREELCRVWQEDVMSNRWNDEGEIKLAG